MASSDRVGAARVVEPLERVLADGLEEAVPRLVAGAFGDDERLVDQLRDTVEHVDAIDAVASHHGFGGVEGEAAREHAEAVEDTPLQRCRGGRRTSRPPGAASDGARPRCGSRP